MNAENISLFLLLLLKGSQAQSVFNSTNDGQCFTSSSGALAIYAPIDSHLCAYKCLKTSSCALISFIRANTTCLLFAKMSTQQYASSTTSKPGACDTWALNWTVVRSAVFSTSGQFTVPAGVSVLKVLAVGGGGGGSCCRGGGSGSGYVSFSNIAVTALQTYTVTIGAGGVAQTNGGSTTFGNNLLVASGGYSSFCSCGGAAGGSGGGAGCGSPSGSGGSGGSSGTTVVTGGSVGTGQGSSFTSYFSQFQLNTLSPGAGAAGVAMSGSYDPGGGGGGGVLINGAGPSASIGECVIGGVLLGPGPPSGYGAGASGGCLSSTLYSGGVGASGLVYIEY